MQADLIVVSEYCSKTNIDLSFILKLEEDGLIEIQKIDEKNYLLASQLNDLERYSRLYYDLSINVPGIGVVNELLDQISIMKREIHLLKSQISTYYMNEDLDIEEY